MNFSITLCLLLLSVSTGVLQISLEKPLGEEATAYNERLVNVRGFLYRHSSGELILASQPNLKSCCVGSQQLVYQQILVHGSLDPEAQAVTLQGIFKIDPQYNDQGQITSLYRLENGEKLKSEHSLLFPILALLGMIGFALFMRE
ncbi:MAG: hypothetical protein ACHQUC_07950 [Chlamydiales bacterium]